MKGNIFISVPNTDLDQNLPISRYDWTENTYTEEGKIDATTSVNPTWNQYGVRYAPQYGTPVLAGSHTVYEMDASWKESEVSLLIALGSGLSAPNYTLMTNAEAREFIAENTPEGI